MREKSVSQLTQATLRQLVEYDPLTGIFHWRVSPAKQIKAGYQAGYLNSNGYITIRLIGKTHKAHRLAWLYIYGVWPNIIDHINGEKSDNRLSNLRDGSQQENCQNERQARSTNRIGLLGVSLHKKTGKFKAQIAALGVNHYLGLFLTPQEAHEAYLLAKRQFHPKTTL